MADYLAIARRVVAERRANRGPGTDSELLASSIPSPTAPQNSSEVAQFPGDRTPSSLDGPVDKPRDPEIRGITPAEWQARQLNKIFAEASPVGETATITADDVARAEFVRRWRAQFGDKPLDVLDEETWRWTKKVLRQAGVRIIWKQGSSRAAEIAIWPERRGLDLEHALRLLKLDHLPIRSRDDP